MDRWTAPSSDDYYDWLNGPYKNFIERVCALCGGKVWVSRHECYLINVVCDRCQQKEAKQ